MKQKEDMRDKKIDRLVNYELDCFYNRSFEDQRQFLKNLFTKEIEDFSINEIDDLIHDFFGDE